jgi:hypothetical protein
METPATQLMFQWRRREGFRNLLAASGKSVDHHHDDHNIHWNANGRVFNGQPYEDPDDADDCAPVTTAVATTTTAATTVGPAAADASQHFRRKQQSCGRRGSEEQKRLDRGAACRSSTQHLIKPAFPGTAGVSPALVEYHAVGVSRLI